MEQVWSGRIVSDATISSAVKSARKALDDSGDTQAMIRTVRGRGFQFVAEVERTTVESNQSTADTLSDKEWRLRLNSGQINTWSWE